MHDFWSASGFAELERTRRGWLRPTDAYLSRFLALPELALVGESCAAERALHQSLVEAPSRQVRPAELPGIEDDDVRSNYAMFLGFRDELLAAGTLEAWYLGRMQTGDGRSDRVAAVPPLFIDMVVQAVLRGILDDCTDAFEARAAELLFRPQRLSISDGRMLCADLQVVDMLAATGGLGDIGRLLRRSDAPLPAVELTVLNTANAAGYWRRSDRHDVVLDLTHEASSDLGHGLSFTTTRKDSGLKALAAVLEKWVAHFLGTSVAIVALPKIADAAWRWHVGLDVESMALLNDLYQDRTVDAQRLGRLLALFRLEFADPHEMRADIAGKPVYLGLAMTAAGTLRLKPQNLLLNLPLAGLM